MKDQTNYEAMCCNKPMRNMGMWPVMGHLGICDPQSDGSINIDIGGEHYIYCHRFHCLECQRYIGIAQHQAPREK